MQTLKWKMNLSLKAHLKDQGVIKGSIKFKGETEAEDDDLALPNGISDYITMKSSDYYVDKTLLVKEILDKNHQISVFSSPTGFGKTVNMDMLRVYFEISNEDTSQYFINTNIWNWGKAYQVHQGKYPVIFLTFKDVKSDDLEKMLGTIQKRIQAEFKRHEYLLNSNNLRGDEKDYFLEVLNGKASKEDLTTSLERLSSILKNHHGIAPILMIDDYDVPTNSKEAKDFMTTFLIKSFKENTYLSYGFLSGKQVVSITDSDYAPYFGFTRQEVHALLKQYELLDKEDKIKDWYGGYLIGDKELYNPSSVIHFIKNDGKKQVYMTNSNLLDNVSSYTNTLLSILLMPRSMTLTPFDLNINKELIQLIEQGFLTIINKEQRRDGSYLLEVSIPNKEVSKIYKKKLLPHNKK